MTSDTGNELRHIQRLIAEAERTDPRPGQRFMWGKDEVTVLAVIRGIGEAIKFRRLRDEKVLQCGLEYFLRMSEPLAITAGARRGET